MEREGRYSLWERETIVAKSDEGLDLWVLY